jgi:hypothetical protein
MAKKRRLPRNIKANSFEYKVIKKRAAGKDFGETDLNRKTVEIYPHESKEMLDDTLIHESLHMLLDDMFAAVLKSEKSAFDKEEDCIKLLTPRLRSWIKDNIKLLEFILDKDIK